MAFAYPVASTKEVEEHLQQLRKTYHDARHHCYAYRLGHQGEEYRANDDGEPNHSAGDPILGQLKSAGLTRVLVVVVRYFGGTKLGVGGLIHAYKSATEDALLNCKIIKQPITATVKLNYNYASTNEVARLIHKYELNICKQNFTQTCFLQAEVIISRQKQLLAELQLLIDTGHSITIG